MNIKGKITGIKYKLFLSEDLQNININDFDINKCPSSCILKDKNHTFAISKWVSPKRTRSYPFERVYKTLATSKKITVIPIIKDEGENGDRDFIQWDTISLMSLLDVFVIFAYYDKAEKSDKSKLKITNQQFNNSYVISKIKEIEQYHSSALHWNINELTKNFQSIIDKVKASYLKIEKETCVKLHNVKGIDSFKEKIGKDVSNFMKFLREKAQAREYVTIHPKESLSSQTKVKITITNYLGGEYFFTVDETDLSNSTIYLIERKHSKTSLLPSQGDIKDGLLKMILYSNLTNVTANDKKVKSKSVLSLTSTKLTGSINSNSTRKDINDFYELNNFSKSQKSLTDTLIKEAKTNKFIIKIQNSK